jgi:glucose/arabinose dehydrogenase
MKRIYLFLGIAVVIVGVAAIWPWRMHIRGIWTALGPATNDIVKEIEEGTKTPTTTGEQPTTSTPSERPPTTTRDLPLTIPSGMSLRVYAKNLGTPRDLLYLDGHLLVSVPSQGKVVRLDEQRDGTANAVTLLDGLNQPHGLAAFCDDFDLCRLFVAETNAVRVFSYEPQIGKVGSGKKILDLPTGGRHTTRSLLVKDDKLYISIGSSCDVCHERDERRATVMIANLDGSDARVYAKGLRNAVFLAENPLSHDIWVTEMGRDMLGDNLPPDEINILKDGGNYGWPICYGANVHDTAFDKNTYIRNPCMEPFEIPAEVELQAHSAPLGLAFFPAEWPVEYRGDLVVAYHGSWNRTTPTGYSLRHIKINAKGDVEGQEDFLTGWLDGSVASGRPADVLFRGKDLFVSDDKAGVIYRITAP